MTLKLSRCLALTALVTLALACSRDAGEQPLVAPPVALGDVEGVEFDERIEATGELVSPSRATIAAEVGGRITALFLDEGSAAARDARVLEIDPERRELERRTAAAGDAEARAAYEEQQRATERVRTLFKNNVASQAQLDQAETQLQLARSRTEASAARLAEARRAARDAEVKAPFAGMVARRFVSVGEFVQPGARLFELVSLDPIEVEFSISEVDSSRVKLGQPVSLKVAPYPNETFAATVSLVSPTIDVASRTLRVKASLPNPDGRLRPGLFAHTDLGVAHREGVVMVPEEAILQRSDGSIVFRARDDKVERVRLRTGVTRAGKVEVISGLTVGEKVVIRGHAGLVDGAKVAVRTVDGKELVPAIASGGEDRPATE